MASDRYSQCLWASVQALGSPPWGVSGFGCLHLAGDGPPSASFSALDVLLGAAPLHITSVQDTVEDADDGSDGSEGSDGPKGQRPGRRSHGIGIDIGTANTSVVVIRGPMSSPRVPLAVKSSFFGNYPRLIVFDVGRRIASENGLLDKAVDAVHRLCGPSSSIDRLFAATRIAPIRVRTLVHLPALGAVMPLETLNLASGEYASQRSQCYTKTFLVLRSTVVSTLKTRVLCYEDEEDENDEDMDDGEEEDDEDGHAWEIEPLEVRAGEHVRVVCSADLACGHPSYEITLAVSGVAGGLERVVRLRV